MLRKIADCTVSATQRFPIAVLMAVLLTLAGWAEVKYTWIHVALISGCFWSVSVVLFAESRQLSTIFKITVSLLGAIILAMLMARETLTIAHYRYGALLEIAPIFILATFGAIGLAPYLRKTATASQFEAFMTQWMRIFCFAFWASILVALGGSALLGSLKYLFGVPVPGEAFTHLLIFCLFLFPVLVALGELPRDFDRDRLPYNKYENALTGNILLPLFLGYALLLWAYAAKIAITMELPKGQVGHMVCWFSLIGAASYVFCYTHAGQHNVMAFFRRYFPVIMSVPLILLGTGVFVRIREYGITPERYGLLTLLIWLSANCMFMLLTRSDRKPIVLYGSAVILLFIAAYGPLSASSVSYRSQMMRLEELLHDAGMLNEKSLIVPEASEKIEPQQRAQIISIMQYFESSGRLPSLRPWFREMPDAHLRRERLRPSSNRVLEDMGIKKAVLPDRDANIPLHYRSSKQSMLNSNVYHAAGYDYIAVVSLNHADQKIIAGKETFRLLLDKERSAVVMESEDGSGRLVFPLEGLAAEAGKNSSQPEKFEFSAMNSRYEVKIEVLNLNGHIDPQNVPHISHVQAVFHIKLKK